MLGHYDPQTFDPEVYSFYDKVGPHTRVRTHARTTRHRHAHTETPKDLPTHTHTQRSKMATSRGLSRYCAHTHACVHARICRRGGAVVCACCAAVCVSMRMLLLMLGHACAKMSQSRALWPLHAHPGSHMHVCTLAPRASLWHSVVLWPSGGRLSRGNRRSTRMIMSLCSKR